MLRTNFNILHEWVFTFGGEAAGPGELVGGRAAGTGQLAAGGAVGAGKSSVVLVF